MQPEKKVKRSERIQSADLSGYKPRQKQKQKREKNTQRDPFGYNQCKRH